MYTASDLHGIAEQSVRDRVFVELQRRVLAGEFSAHTRLVEERIGETLGVSRTPVREALVRLVAQGLVVRTPDGYFVSVPDLLRLRDLYELRLTLELRGLARAQEPGVVHDEDALRAQREHWLAKVTSPPVPSPDFVLEDEAFHVGLSRAAGNPEITEVLESVNAKIRSVRMYDFLTEDRISATVTEHLAILDLTLARDLPAAIDALAAHIGESLAVVEERAVRALTARALHRTPRSGDAR